MSLNSADRCGGMIYSAGKTTIAGCKLESNRCGHFDCKKKSAAQILAPLGEGDDDDDMLGGGGDDDSALGAVADALGLGSATTDVAYTSMVQVGDMLADIKERLVVAMEPGVDRQKVQAEISQLQAAIVATSQAASFSGQNWLQTNVPDIYLLRASACVGR